MSNIDLTSQTRHSFTKQSRDYSAGLYDLYSRIESRKDYQNIYKFSEHSAHNSEYFDMNNRFMWRDVSTMSMVG